MRLYFCVILIIATALRAQDTLNVAHPDTLLRDTLSTSTEPAAPRADWKGRLLVIPLESDLDSASQAFWNSLVLRLLEERKGPPPLPVQLSEFTGCQDLDCLLQQTRSRGAQGLFTGRVRSARDSLDVRFRIQWVQGKRIAVSEAREKIPAELSALLQEGTLPRLIAEATGAQPPRPKETRSWVHVQTDQDGAVISVDNGQALCKTPCTFVRSDTGTISISAYWRVENNLWAGKASTRLIAGDTAKVFLRLQRAITAVEIRSEPPGAEILPPTPLEPTTRAWGRTPFTLLDRDPGELQVRLWSPGYRDTLLTLSVDVLEKNIYAPALTAITDPAELVREQSIVRHRRQRTVGFALLGASLTPMLIGSTLMYLAQDDYQDARSIKRDLESIPSVGGSGYEAKRKANKDAVERGDTKFYTGTGLIGLGLLLASAGIVIVF